MTPFSSRNAERLGVTGPEGAFEAAEIVKIWRCEMLRDRPIAGVPGWTATVFAERVGWEGSDSWFGAQVADPRPGFEPLDPEDRLVDFASDQMKFDF